MNAIPCPLCDCQVTCSHSQAEREAVWTFYEIGTIESMQDDGPLTGQWNAYLFNLRDGASMLPDVGPILDAHYD
jgi:hypothetical protein